MFTQKNNTLKSVVLSAKELCKEATCARTTAVPVVWMRGLSSSIQLVQRTCWVIQRQNTYTFAHRAVANYKNGKEMTQGHRWSSGHPHWRHLLLPARSFAQEGASGCINVILAVLEIIGFFLLHTLCVCQWCGCYLEKKNGLSACAASQFSSASIVCESVCTKPVSLHCPSTSHQYIPCFLNSSSAPSIEVLALNQLVYYSNLTAH